MKPKLFLTGATSYLGTKFIELYGEQFELFKVSRNGESPLDLKNHTDVAESFEHFNPDFVIHLAADLKRHAEPGEDILRADPAITENLLTLSSRNNTPFVFTSTEAIYDGKGSEGNYLEDDIPHPRSIYAESKVVSEGLVKNSGLPYLITRGHRHVGINKHYKGSKLFSDAFKAITNGETVHLDSHKLFTPTLLNHMCNVIFHFITTEASSQTVLNVASEPPITYFDFMIGIAEVLNLDSSIIKNDGEELAWPSSSSLCTERLRSLGYPNSTYEDILKTIAKDNAE